MFVFACCISLLIVRSENNIARDQTQNASQFPSEESYFLPRTNASKMLGGELARYHSFFSVDDSRRLSASSTTNAFVTDVSSAPTTGTPEEVLLRLNRQRHRQRLVPIYGRRNSKKDYMKNNDNYEHHRRISQKLRTINRFINQHPFSHHIKYPKIGNKSFNKTFFQARDRHERKLKSENTEIIRSPESEPGLSMKPETTRDTMTSALLLVTPNLTFEREIFPVKANSRNSGDEKALVIYESDLIILSSSNRSDRLNETLTKRKYPANQKLKNIVDKSEGIAIERVYEESKQKELDKQEEKVRNAHEDTIKSINDNLTTKSTKRLMVKNRKKTIRDLGRKSLQFHSVSRDFQPKLLSTEKQILCNEFIISCKEYLLSKRKMMRSEFPQFPIRDGFLLNEENSQGLMKVIRLKGASANEGILFGFGGRKEQFADYFKFSLGTPERHNESKKVRKSVSRKTKREMRRRRRRKRRSPDMEKEEEIRDDSNSEEKADKEGFIFEAVESNPSRITGAPKRYVKRNAENGDTGKWKEKKYTKENYNDEIFNKPRRMVEYELPYGTYNGGQKVDESDTYMMKIPSPLALISPTSSIFTPQGPAPHSKKGFDLSPISLPSLTSPSLSPDPGRATTNPLTKDFLNSFPGVTLPYIIDEFYGEDPPYFTMESLNSSKKRKKAITEIHEDRRGLNRVGDKENLYQEKKNNDNNNNTKKQKVSTSKTRLEELEEDLDEKTRINNIVKQSKPERTNMNRLEYLHESMKFKTKDNTNHNGSNNNNSNGTVAMTMTQYYPRTRPENREIDLSATDEVVLDLVPNNGTNNSTNNNTANKSANRNGGESSEMPLLDTEGSVRIPCYVIIFLSGVIGNSLVIVTLLQNRKMRTITNVFLLNLAVSDLLLGVFCMPFTLVGSLLRDFIFGGIMCRLIPYFQAVSVSVSVWTLVAISLERYYAICQPLRSRGWQTLSHAYKIITLVWLVSLAAMAPIAILSQLLPVGDTSRHKCREMWPTLDLERIFSMFLLVGLLVVPLVIMVAAYSSITVSLWHGMRLERETGQGTRALISLTDLNGLAMVQQSLRRKQSRRVSKISIRFRKIPAQTRTCQLCGNSDTMRSQLSHSGVPPTPEHEGAHGVCQHGQGYPQDPDCKWRVESVNENGNYRHSSSKPAFKRLRSTHLEKSIEAKKHVIRMLFVVVLEFFLCWSPIFIVNIMYLYIPEQVYRTLGSFGISFLHLLSYASSCCNPITYCFMNKKFLQGFRHAFGCRKENERTARYNGTAASFRSQSNNALRLAVDLKKDTRETTV